LEFLLLASMASMASMAMKMAPMAVHWCQWWCILMAPMVNSAPPCQWQSPVVTDGAIFMTPMVPFLWRIWCHFYITPMVPLNSDETIILRWWCQWWPMVPLIPMATMLIHWWQLW
jgi:hypothetical protein